MHCCHSFCLAHIDIHVQDMSAYYASALLDHSSLLSAPWPRFCPVHMGPTSLRPAATPAFVPRCSQTAALMHDPLTAVPHSNDSNKEVHIFQERLDGLGSSTYMAVAGAGPLWVITHSRRVPDPWELPLTQKQGCVGSGDQRGCSLSGEMRSIPNVCVPTMVRLHWPSWYTSSVGRFSSG